MPRSRDLLNPPGQAQVVYKTYINGDRCLLPYSLQFKNGFLAYDGQNCMSFTNTYVLLRTMS